MKISVFGIGYVGAVSAACIANDGHEVVSVDVNSEKVKAINAGRSPIFEPGLPQAIGSAVREGRLTATSDTMQAIRETDLSMICVGTPSRPNGSLDTSSIVRAADTIGAALREKSVFHAVVVRSTILPGTTENVVIPALERASGMKAGQFGLAYYPEFLRETTAIQDYYNPGTIVFGKHGQDGRTIAMLMELCSNLPVAPTVLPIRGAEALKYANNAWHALKVSFANEIGNVCKAFGVDSWEVMDVLCSDTRLNISPAYLRPGFSFGGSCLPKDLRAVRHAARQLDVATPVLDATQMANDLQLSKAFEMIAQSNSRRVGMIGLSFKSETDDLRESPLVELAERLLGKGFDLRIFDPNVFVSSLTGTNLEYVRAHLPHLSDLLVGEADELVQHSRTIVIGKNGPVAEEVLSKVGIDTTVIDLVRVRRLPRASTYDGICW
ncbi:MAG: nucleotide sugar dehydrogenase [Propylenella sp.]